MTGNTFCVLEAGGLVVRLTLAAEEPEVVNNTVAAEPTYSDPVQQLFRVIAHASRARVEKLGSKGESALRSN